MVNSSSKSFLFYTSLTKKSLHNYKNYISSLLKKFHIDFKIVSLPLKKKKKTILKSPHVTKKAKESFELTFFKFVVIIDFNNKLLKLLRSNVPNTMHLKCVITS
jgi:ribosomal protein S10|tara:strand:- start:11106 stop:11417 length:312 start_codon:yes stop_codon:yes gene_type:complete